MAIPEISPTTIAMQHADDGYSRDGNFYDFSLVCNTVLIYLSHGTYVYLFIMKFVQ